MTCFWDGLVEALTRNTIKNVLGCTLSNNNKKNKTHLRDFVNTLKEKNTKTYNVLWNGNELTEQEQITNYDTIKLFNVDSIEHGYLCCASDPFLFLISQLFNRHITFCFNKTFIFYINKKIPVISPNLTLHFRSDTRHFSLNSKKIIYIPPDTNVGTTDEDASSKVYEKKEGMDELKHDLLIDNKIQKKNKQIDKIKDQNCKYLDINTSKRKQRVCS